MEKDFMQLNEKELKDVAGGYDGNLYGSETIIFLRKKTPEDALAYLREQGIPDRNLNFYMNEWHKNHK